jgi:hypothetical protein
MILEASGGTGMEAIASRSKGLLECVEEAKSPHRILVRSLLKSRNTLRAKYRDLRAECKRWRNQAAAVEKSRAAWRHRALATAAALRDERAGRAALESRAPASPEPGAEPGSRPVAEGAEKRGR